jgi:hypothetical protein
MLARTILEYHKYTDLVGRFVVPLIPRSSCGHLLIVPGNHVREAIHENHVKASAVTHVRCCFSLRHRRTRAALKLGVEAFTYHELVNVPPLRFDSIPDRPLLIVLIFHLPASGSAARSHIGCSKLLLPDRHTRLTTS